ncbi:hypothetical protein LB507_009798 [Fusarium sp. FIESC RH6]|nr:hypothetical protein LB507_009798 [Fusarium sp. FIESC RH6]
MTLSNRLGAFTVLNLSLISSALASQTCSQLSGRDYTDGPNGRNFEILCDTSTVGGHIIAYYSQGDLFQDCVDRCDYDSNCNVALYLQSSGDCALIDSYEGTRSFNGNDIAIARPATIPTTTSAEPSSAETTTAEATTTETTTTETASSQAPTAETTSSETTSVENSAAESSTTEPSLSETTAADTTSTSVTETATSTIDLSTTQSSTQSSTNEPSSTEPSSTYGTSSETSSNVQDSTTTSITDSSYTSTTSTEASTDDCDNETSSHEAPTTSVDSTSTGTESDVQPTTSSTQSLRGSTSIPESSEPSTSAFSTIQTISVGSTSLTTTTEVSVPVSQSTSVTSQEVSSISASSKSATTQIYAPPSQATSMTGSSSSETQKSGSKTLPSYGIGITTMKTTTQGRLPTYAPASDCVWTVYLTMVKYVTCSTGVVPETSTTATYVTVDGSAVTHGPPVIHLPSGCIGGYQVDASGHSYPVVQPTMGSQGYPSGEKNRPSARPTLASPGGSQPSSGNSQYHVPAPTAGSQGPHLPEKGTEKPSIHSTQGSQGNSHDSMDQPPVSDQDSPEHNGGEPHRTQGEAAPTAISAYHYGSPAYPSLISPIHQGQHNTSLTFTVKTATTGGVEEHKASSPSSAEAPSTPLIASGSSKHQSMLWASIAGAFMALSMLSV